MDEWMKEWMKEWMNWINKRYFIASTKYIKNFILLIISEVRLQHVRSQHEWRATVTFDGTLLIQQNASQ